MEVYRTTGHGRGSRLNQGTAACSSCFHLPGFIKPGALLPIPDHWAGLQDLGHPHLPFQSICCISLATGTMGFLSPFPLKREPPKVEFDGFNGSHQQIDQLLIWGNRVTPAGPFPLTEKGLTWVWLKQ